MPITSRYRRLRMLIGSCALACGAALAADGPLAAAAPFTAVCPEGLPTAHVPARDAADGWAASASQTWPVDGSGMLHGPHDGEGYLIPGSAEVRKRGDHKTDIRRWSFDKPHWFETWLYCGYGPVQLAMRIPVDATECRVTVEFNKGQRGPTVFVCK